MRLGAYPCALKPGTLAAQTLRQADEISERHRHRFEVNNAYREPRSRSGGWCFRACNPSSTWSR